jgi:5-methylcytosine-specific restriction endonuclease McrA
MIQDGKLIVRAPFTQVAPRVDAEVDHVVPLWKVPPCMPWERKIEYWRIGNLQVLCPECHKRKTAREAAERAKANRLKQGSRAKRKQRQERLPF